MLFYSKSNCGFYDDTINKILPDDLVEITPEYHQELLNRSYTERLDIIADENGYPILVPTPPLPPEVLAEGIRERRNQILAKIDKIGVQYREELDSGLTPTLSEKNYKIYLAYKQELRNISLQENFPNDVIWPTLVFE
jgi:hypothetical protein